MLTGTVPFFFFFFNDGVFGGNEVILSYFGWSDRFVHFLVHYKL